MGISIWQLLIILLIVALLFGTKRLRNIGGDLGIALKNFKSGIKDALENDDKTSVKEPDKLTRSAGEQVYRLADEGRAAMRVSKGDRNKAQES